MAEIPSGKKTARIDVPVTEELRADVAAIARMHGFSGPADFVRDHLERLVYGELAMFRRYRANRGGSIGGNSDE